MRIEKRGGGGVFGPGSPEGPGLEEGLSRLRLRQLLRGDAQATRRAAGCAASGVLAPSRADGAERALRGPAPACRLPSETAARTAESTSSREPGTGLGRRQWPSWPPGGAGAPLGVGMSPARRLSRAIWSPLSPAAACFFFMVAHPLTINLNSIFVSCFQSLSLSLSLCFSGGSSQRGASQLREARTRL